MWAFMKWCGRVALWVLFLPLGLWRSYRHGAEKRTRRIQETIAARPEAPFPTHWQMGHLPPSPPPPPPHQLST